MENDLRNSIVSKILLLREYNRIDPTVMKCLKPIRRQSNENDFQYNDRLRTTIFNAEELLTEPLSLFEKVLAYETLLGYMDAIINFTHDQKRMEIAMKLISNWGSSMRSGNGELPYWENKRMRNRVTRQMKDLYVKEPK